MKRKSTKNKRNPVFIGQIRDIDGGLWDVREVRATEHGFDLFFGSPVTRLDGFRSGKPHLIPTQALFDYWEARKTHSHGTIHDLPICHSTVTSMRRRLGFNYFESKSSYWRDHAEELKNMTALQCAAHLGVDIQEVYVRRHGFKTIRHEPNWWLKPENAAILMADRPLKDAAHQLGVSMGLVCRLRKHLRNIAQDTLGGEILLAA